MKKGILLLLLLAISFIAHPAGDKRPWGQLVDRMDQYRNSDQFEQIQREVEDRIRARLNDLVLQPCTSKEADHLSTLMREAAECAAFSDRFRSEMYIILGNYLEIKLKDIRGAQEAYCAVYTFDNNICYRAQAMFRLSYINYSHGVRKLVTEQDQQLLRKSIENFTALINGDFTGTTASELESIDEIKMDARYYLACAFLSLDQFDQAMPLFDYVIEHNSSFKNLAMMNRGFAKAMQFRDYHGIFEMLDAYDAFTDETHRGEAYNLIKQAVRADQIITGTNLNWLVESLISRNTPSRLFVLGLIAPRAGNLGCDHIARICYEHMVADGGTFKALALAQLAKMNRNSGQYDEAFAQATEAYGLSSRMNIRLDAKLVIACVQMSRGETVLAADILKEALLILNNSSENAISNKPQLKEAILQDLVILNLYQGKVLIAKKYLDQLSRFNGKNPRLSDINKAYTAMVTSVNKMDAPYKFIAQFPLCGEFLPSRKLPSQMAASEWQELIMFLTVFEKDGNNISRAAFNGMLNTPD